MSTTTAAAPLTPKATRITKEAATTLLQYFTLAKWPLNKSLPRSDLHGDLAAIAKKYGLTKKQVARQLKSYKEKKYRMKDVVLDFSPERIKEMLEEGIGMESRAFVVEVLSKLRDNDRNLGSRDVDNFARVIQQFPPVALGCLRCFCAQDSPHAASLANQVDAFVTIASEEFPKSIARLPDADLKFMVRLRRQKSKFIQQWMEQRDALHGADSVAFPTEKYRYFGSFLFDVMFDCWSLHSMEAERPSVTMPEQCLVGKYARPVVYYVAGWTLHSLSLARTIARNMQPLYRRFADQHIINEEVAAAEDLPVSLVKKRNTRALLFSSAEYFDFICFVESVFVDNLTLEMMVGHPEGNIIQFVKSYLLKSDEVMLKFDGLCGDGCYSSEEKQLVIKYVMDRYANMRGTYFVKYMSGSQGASATDAQVASLATRTKVITAVASSKAKAEQNLWASAGESAIEHSLQFEIADVNEQ